MVFINGTVADFTIGGTPADLSPYMNSIKFSRKTDSHDVTTFGAASHTYQSGLMDGTIDLAGFYASGVTGPSAVLQPLLGTIAAFVYYPEGNSSGKPKLSGNALVTGYDESTPVADVITWTASLQITGDVTVGSVSA